MKNEIKTKTNYSLKDLARKTFAEVESLKDEYSEIERCIQEVCDNHTPIYNWDLAQFLAHNFLLSSSQGYENKEDIFSNIGQRVYFYIEEYCYEKANEKGYFNE